MCPFFSAGNTTGEMLLDEAVDPALTDMDKSEWSIRSDRLIFRQDGFSPHYVVPIRPYLNERFSERLFGKRVPSNEVPIFEIYRLCIFSYRVY